MGKIIGIDLGIINFCVVILENGNVKVIENVEGVCIIFLIIVYINDGEILVGQLVKCQVVINLQNILYVVKCLIGCCFEENVVQKDIQMVLYSIVKVDNGDVWVEVKGQKMVFLQIFVEVLKKMKKIVEDYFGELVIEVVIIVLVYFNDSQCQVIKDVGCIVGFDVKWIINELIVVVLVYGLDKVKGDYIVIVYDLGGGIFDVLVIEIVEVDGEYQFEVLVINGDIFFGGEDFDICLIDYFVDEFKKESGINLKGDLLVMQCLKEVVEKVKIELFLIQQIDVNLLYVIVDVSGLKYLNVKVFCVKLEFLVEDLVQCIIELCCIVLKDVGLDVFDIYEVILVGGQICMLLVQKIVVEFFGKEVCKDVNLDEVVVVGVVIQGVVLVGDVKDVLLFDVILLIFGIEILGGVMIGLIEKNIIILIKKLQVFFIVDDNQGVVIIYVLQGECKQVVQNKLLGKFDLVDILLVLCGVLQIEVIFDIDVNGILYVLVKDKVIGKQQFIVIKVFFGLFEDEIQQMVCDVEVNVEEDCKFEELVVVCNQGDVLVYVICKMIIEVGDKVIVEDKVIIEKVLGELEVVVKGDDKVEIEVKMNVLFQVFILLVQKMYVEQVQQGEDVFQGEQVKVVDDVVDVEFEEVKDNK